MTKDSLIHNPMGIPSIQIGRERFSSLRGLLVRRNVPL